MLAKLKKIKLRTVVQSALFALFAYLIIATTWKPPQFFPVDFFLKYDPLLNLQAALSARAAGWGLLGGCVFLILAFVFGRFFCGYVCPAGTFLELGEKLIYGRKKRLWKNSERKARWLKYGVLSLVITAAIFGAGAAYLVDPISWITRLFAYALMPAVYAFGNIALDSSRPLIEWAGFFELSRAELAAPVFGFAGIFAVAFFAFLFWLSRYQSRFWCRSVCPLGALLAVPARYSLFKRIAGDACDADGKCGRICPTGAIKDDYKKYDAGECVFCLDCVPVCHAKTTSFRPAIKNAQANSSFDMNRRKSLAFLGSGAAAGLFLMYNPTRSDAARLSPRPPASLPENDFLAVCIRCGQCVKACPTGCLQPSLSETGATGFLTPIAVMRIGQCDPNCNACCNVCPTDAIRPISAAEKPYAKIGNASIDKARCIAYDAGKACLVCDENCPYGAIYWEEASDKSRRPVVYKNRCNGCGACEKACPVDGPSAIRISVDGQIRLMSGSYITEAKLRGLLLENKNTQDGGYGK